MKKRYFISIFVGLLMILVGCNNTPAVEEVSEIDKLFPKDETGKRNMYFDIKNATYNPNKKEVEINLNTNIPEGTEVEVTFSTDDEDSEYDYSTVTNNVNTVSVKKGEIETTFTPDEYLPIVNGKYEVGLSIELAESKNTKLYDILDEEYMMYSYTDDSTLEHIKEEFNSNIDVSSYEAWDKSEIDLPTKMFNIQNASTIKELKVAEKIEKEKREELKKQEQADEAKIIKEKKDSAEYIEFAQIEKNPDKYMDQYVKYQGQIVQILEGDSTTDIRLSVTKESYGYSINDIIYITYPDITDFVKDDIITVYGNVQGSYTYESQAGYTISLPWIEADIID